MIVENSTALDGVLIIANDDSSVMYASHCYVIDDFQGSPPGPVPKIRVGIIWLRVG